MRSCTSRWAPSAGSPQRRVHEGGSSKEWRSYSALGPDSALGPTLACKREKCEIATLLCSLLPLG